MQAVVYLIPKGGLAQAVLDDFIQMAAAADPLQARAVGDIFEDRFGERIGFLEDQSHASAKVDQIGERRVDVLPVDGQAAGDPATRDHVVEPVDRAQQAGFAATARPDERHNAIARDAQRHLLDRLMVSVKDADRFDGYCRHRRRRINARSRLAK